MSVRLLLTIFCSLMLIVGTAGVLASPAGAQACPNHRCPK
jgi:hypothetical protein